MRVIHKEGPFIPGQPFEIESMVRLSHFAEQAGNLYVWIERDLEKSIQRNKAYLIVGTGWDYESSLDHKMTAVDGNLYVWHLLQQRELFDNFADRIF